MLVLCPYRHLKLIACATHSQVLRLGNVVPDFSAQTTHGDMPSWHEWIDGSWAILFSHPADFTVRFCPTVVARMTQMLLIEEDLPLCLAPCCRQNVVFACGCLSHCSIRCIF